MDMELGSSQFWISLLQIIWIDLVLSGDNAVVIALACRSLPDNQRRWGVILGAGTAIGLRILFAFFIIQILAVPYLKVVGAVLLLWIAVKLVLPQDEGHGKIAASSNLFAAIRTIAIADAVMSLDNVIAIAAASHGSVVLLALGLLISIPLIVFGSTLLLRAIDRYPIIIYLGAGLLGWISGEMIVTDPALVHWVETEAPLLHRLAPAVGAAAVVAVGYLLARSALAARRRDAAAAAETAAP